MDIIRFITVYIVQGLMKDCKVCGNDIPSSAIKCTHCDSYQSGVKACKSCGSDMLKNTHKCHNCGSFQNWRGHINLSSTVLALLVALVTVITAAYPIMVEALTDDNSIVNLVFQSSRKDSPDSYGYIFIAGNSGNRPAGLGESIYQIEIDRSSVDKDVVNEIIKDNPEFNIDTSDILLKGKTDVRMLIEKKNFSEPFLLPGNSYQLYLDVETDTIFAYKKSLTTLDKILSSSPLSSKYSIDINDTLISRLLSDYAYNNKNDNVRCSILFNVINFNSELESKRVKIDCHAFLDDIFKNFNKS